MRELLDQAETLFPHSVSLEQEGRMSTNFGPTVERSFSEIPADSIVLEGDLNIPSGAEAIVLFAHGSGSSRHRNEIDLLRERSAKARSLPC